MIFSETMRYSIWWKDAYYWGWHIGIEPFMVKRSPTLLITKWTINARFFARIIPDHGRFVVNYKVFCFEHAHHMQSLCNIKLWVTKTYYYDLMTTSWKSIAANPLLLTVRRISNTERLWHRKQVLVNSWRETTSPVIF